MTGTRPSMGLMDQGWAAPEVSDGDAIAATLRAVCAAEEAGLDSAWIGQHHFRRQDAPYWGRISATEVFLAHAGALTSRIRLGTGVRVLSTTSAQRAAEEMNLLSRLLAGRVEFGIGLGSHGNVTGTPEEKAERFRSLLGELLGFLADDPGVAELPLSPSSPVELGQRIWAAARDAPTIALLAELCVNLVVGQAEIATAQAEFVRRYRAAGGSGRTRGVRVVFVAPSREEALAESAAAADLYFSAMSKGGYYRQAVERGLITDPPRSRTDMLSAINFIAGSPADVTAQLNDYLATTRVDQLDVMAHLPRIALPHVRRSMELLQSEVRPNLVYDPLPAGAMAA